MGLIVAQTSRHMELVAVLGVLMAASLITAQGDPGESLADRPDH